MNANNHWNGFETEKRNKSSNKKTIKKETESDGLLNEGKEERVALLKATRKQHGRNQRGREPYKLKKTVKHQGNNKGKIDFP